MKKGNQRLSVSASCFLPTALFSLPLTAWLAKKAGFAGIEAIPFRGPVLEVLLRGVPENLAVPVASAHCRFSKKSFWTKVGESRPGTAVKDLILLPTSESCEIFLTKLATIGASVNTYFIEDLERQGIYTSYQAAPCFDIPLEDVVSRLEETGVKVTFDLSHIRDGEPFPDWRTCWETLHDRVDNIHVQALNPAEPKSAELRAMWEGDQNIEIAEMLWVVGESGYEGPITLEVDPRHMVQILGWKALLPQVQVRYLSKLRLFVEAQLE